MAIGITSAQIGRTSLARGTSTLTAHIWLMAIIWRKVMWSITTVYLFLVKIKIIMGVDFSSIRASWVKCLVLTCGTKFWQPTKCCTCQQTVLMVSATIWGGAISWQAYMEMWAKRLLWRACHELNMSTVHTTMLVLESNCVYSCLKLFLQT